MLIKFSLTSLFVGAMAWKSPIKMPAVESTIMIILLSAAHTFTTCKNILNIHCIYNLVNPLNSESDHHLLFPYNITLESQEKITS